MFMQGFFFFSVAFFPKLLYNTTRSFIRMWLSLVEHVLWEHGAAGSNPVIRTKSRRKGCLAPALFQYFTPFQYTGVNTSAISGRCTSRSAHRLNSSKPVRSTI